MSELRFAVLGPVRAWRRDTELDLGSEVFGLLSTRDRRIVVLTGAGGIGKTRLALLERSRPYWRDGAAFVDPAERLAALGVLVRCGGVRKRERAIDLHHEFAARDALEHVADHRMDAGVLGHDRAAEVDAA
jgi:hypothetical protein